MGIFEDTITKAKEVFEETGKFTEEAIATQKLKFKASSVKSEINKNYELLGKYVYQSVISEEEPISEMSQALVDEIKELREQYEKLNAEIASSKGKKICSCGAVNSADAKYCNSCGKEI